MTTTTNPAPMVSAAMVPRTTPAVALCGVSRTYGTGLAAVRAVDHVDLEFPRGTWTAVMGPSGSGKSTLLHCAAGLERVDAGQVLLGDNDITAASDGELTALRRDRVGFVFQSFNPARRAHRGAERGAPTATCRETATEIAGAGRARGRRHGRPRQAPTT
jgi:ABC-type dipeptide/oligopeptide/nickel transport system ATPase subunit